MCGPPLYDHLGDGRDCCPARPPPIEDPTEDDLLAAAEKIDIMLEQRCIDIMLELSIQTPDFFHVNL